MRLIFRIVLYLCITAQVCFVGIFVPGLPVAVYMLIITSMIISGVSAFFMALIGAIKHLNSL